jgi:hypothetical protein
VVRERFELVSRTLPMFRQIVVETPGPHPPRWEFAADFDPGFHLRRVSAPEPGNLDGVLELARVAAMSDFDRARPLWTATLIEGLDDGGAAVLLKFHHALTDGVGGVQIAMMIFDITEDPRPAAAVAAGTDQPEVHPHGPLSSYLDALRYDVGVLGQAVRGAVTNAPKLLFTTARRPIQTARAAPDDADQHSRRERRHGRKPNHAGALRCSGRDCRPGPADQRDPRALRPGP